MPHRGPAMYLTRVKKKEKKKENPGHRNTLHCTAPKTALCHPAFALLWRTCHRITELVGSIVPNGFIFHEAKATIFHHIEGDNLMHWCLLDYSV